MQPTHYSDSIADLLARDAPRAKSLVVTIFGDAIVPHGGLVWLGSLIGLLEPFGVNERLLRTSVFRLAQEGWLSARRDGRRSAYAITPDAMARFIHAYRRIYAPPAAHWDGCWTLVLTGDSALNAAERGAVRKELLWEGYRVIAPGVIGHPAGDGPALDELLTRLGVAGKLHVLRGAAMPLAAARPLDGLADGWDLDGVAGAYCQFIAQFKPLRALLRDQAGTDAPTPEQAYVIRTLLIHAYRRVQLHDPQLPSPLLPADWPGAQAYQLAGAIYRAVQAAAESHIDAMLRREDSAAPPAEAAFFSRFGGLA